MWFRARTTLHAFINNQLHHSDMRELSTTRLLKLTSREDLRNSVVKTVIGIVESVDCSIWKSCKGEKDPQASLINARDIGNS